MAGRTIAMGDIHGCSRALQTILDAIRLQPDDTLVTLGDYIDRGPDSRGVLAQLVELVDRCTLVPLLGNHELMLLHSFTHRAMQDFWRHCGGEETLASYGWDLNEIPPDHLVFLRGLQPFHESDTHLFVHANYDPDRPLMETSEQVLYWEHLSARIPAPHFSRKTALVGHTPQATGEVLDLGHVVCLDTYCFGGGWLSALDVEDRTLWQANERGEVRIGQL